MGHVSAQEFLNKYNILDAYLRDIVGADESKGMVSLYKDTLDDPEEQMQLRTMNKLRNEIAHGVFPSNEPIKVDKSFVSLLDKHIRYVRTHQKEVKKKMLVAISNRRKKDEQRNKAFHGNETNEFANSSHVEKPSVSRLRFINVDISNCSGVYSFEDGDSFYSEFPYSIKNGTLYIENCSGVGKVVLPPGRYNVFHVENASGSIMVMTHEATFNEYQKHNFSGILHVADKA